MALADLRIVGLVGGHERGAHVARDQRLGHADRARGVLHPYRGRRIVRVDLQRGMRARGGGPADHQRHLEALALHFAGHVGHLFQRRGDQAGQADDVGVLGPGPVQDGLGGDHHPQVDHLEVVAGQDHPDDVLADVVHVALDRGHDDLAVGGGRIAGAQLFGLDEGQQVGHRLLHHPRGLDHLGQEHLAGAEQVADHVHPIHQRAFDHIQRTGRLGAGLLGVGLDEGVDAMHQRMGQALAHAAGAPLQVFDLLLTLLALVAFGDFQQALGAVLAPVEDHILHPLAQFRVQVIVDRQRAGVDDAHVHTRGDGVVQEHRVDRRAHGLVAAEGERHVRHPPGHVAVRQGLLDDAGGLDEVHRVVVVLLDAGGHGKDVGVEDDVFGRKADLFGQDPVGARADLDLARAGVGLADFVEGHDHRGRAIAADLQRMFDEGRFAFLERDRIDHALALQALQAGLDHAPPGTVHHHRDAGDIRLGHDQVEKAHHRLLRIDHALVHVDVQDLGAVVDLLARHFDGFLVALFLDQLAELGAAGDVGALADVDEQQLRGDDQRLKAGQAGVAGGVVHEAWMDCSLSPASCAGERVGVRGRFSPKR